MAEVPEAPPVCMFCPADERVPATHTYVDPNEDPRDRYVYRLCRRHWGPIGQWLEKQRKAQVHAQETPPAQAQPEGGEG